MKTIIRTLFLIVFPPLLMAAAWGCNSKDDEPTAPPELYLLEGDSIALCHISESFNTTSANYPHPWSMADRGSWKGSIELDTIFDFEIDRKVLIVSALTLYIPEPGQQEVMTNWISELEHVKSFKLYACPGAIVNGGCVPTGCDSVLIDKINPDSQGYINVVPDGIWYVTGMSPDRWLFSKLTIHGTDMQYISAILKYDAIVDLSNNQLKDDVGVMFENLLYTANLSHNQFTGFDYGWETWYNRTIPNLQYNEIQIPEEMLGTDFWRENHELFIGNPGYQAPK